MAQPFDSLRCKQVSESLEALVDEELSAGAGDPDAATLLAHLTHCPACTAEYELAVAIRHELRALPELDAPPAMIDRVLQPAREASPLPAQPSRPKGWAAPRTRRLAWAASFTAALITAGLWVGSLRQRPSPGPAIPEVDPAVVAAATEEARFALTYLTRLHRRAGLELQQDLLIERLTEPALRTLSRSLNHRSGTDAKGSKDPRGAADGNGSAASKRSADGNGSAASQRS